MIKMYKRNERILAILNANLIDKTEAYIKKNDERFFAGGIHYENSIQGYFKSIITYCKKIENYYKGIQVSDKDLASARNKLLNHMWVHFNNEGDGIKVPEQDEEYIGIMCLTTDYMKTSSEKIKGMDSDVKTWCKYIETYSEKIQNRIYEEFKE